MSKRLNEQGSLRDTAQAVFFCYAEMLKSCQYCGRVHDKNYICRAKPKRIKYKTSEAMAFRNSSEWRRLRKLVKDRDLWTCQACVNKLGSNIKPFSRQLEVHHIIPIEEDYERRSDEENLITLCDWHHEEAEKGSIARTVLLNIAKQNAENNK